MSPFLALVALQAVTLKVGDPAPALTVGSWIKGSPVASFEKGKVYVVEFWATWCGPCKANMPHLSEVARKMRGKADVIGVDVWERPPTSEADVKAFVAKMGQRMDYNVVRDDADANMSKNWLRAAGRNGIPSAFVVGRDGKILWVGHPASRMEQVLEAVVDNKFDPVAESAIQAKLDAERTEQTEAILAYRKSVLAGERSSAEVALATYISAHPGSERAMWSGKYQTLLQSDEGAAYDYARTLASGMLKDDAQGLYMLSVLMLGSSAARLKNPDHKLALRLAEQAAALPSTDSRPYVITTLAMAQKANGQIDKAKETLRQELERLEKAKDIDPDAIVAVQNALKALP